MTETGSGSRLAQEGGRPCGRQIESHPLQPQAGGGAFADSPDHSMRDASATVGSAMDTGSDGEEGEVQQQQAQAAGGAGHGRAAEPGGQSRPAAGRTLSGEVGSRNPRGLPPTMMPMGWEMPMADVIHRDILQQASDRSGAGEASAASNPDDGQAGVPDAGQGAQASAQAVAAATAAAAAIVGQERPCTVKLRLWKFDVSAPRRLLVDPCLTIPHTVLCSEMGVHFSPCGRYLAACVACKPPPSDDPDAAGPGGSQPASPVYELRVISLEKQNFGAVLKARQVRAAHCLTSIQFSPASDHLLLAYGRRHISLLRSLVADGGSIIPVHTILEVYRVSDMSLVRVLPSAEDEVNVAAFHPMMGGGIAYGTKEGRLRILRHDRSPNRPMQATEQAGRSLEDELLEADQLVDSGTSDSEDGSAV